MRTPHPVVAESLSGEFEREAREAPLRAQIAELEGRLAGQLAAAEYAIQYTMTVWSEEEGREVSFRDSEVDRRLNAAFADPSPSVQALTRLVEAVGRTVEAFERESSKEEHAALAKEVTAAYRAYQAARSGRREGK